MKIAVSGKNGQVATALASLNEPQVEVLRIGRPELDLSSPQTVFDALRRVSPDVVVSSAAYTAVDKAEVEIEAAFAINRDGACAVAEAAAVLRIPVIHLSTDYVFDGLKTSAYVEDDPTAPACVYGASKLAGEISIASATPNHAILRTAWIYSPYGGNFVKTMLNLSETRDTVRVVSDQFGCPTSADDIARAVVTVARRLIQDASPTLRGVFHLTGTGETSWAGFAKHIFAISEEIVGKHIAVQEINTTDYPTLATRPPNSRLNCGKFERCYGLRLPHWKDSTRRVVTTLLKERIS